MNGSWKPTLLAGLSAALAVAGYAHLNASLGSIEDRLARIESAAPDRSKAKPEGKAEPAAAPAPTGNAEVLAEIDALRAEVDRLRHQAGPTPVAAATEPTSGAEAVAPAVSGDVAAVFDAERVAAIRKVVEDTLADREDARRKERAAQEVEQMKERRKRVLDDLEQRLKLTTYQREQINALLDERNKGIEEARAAAEAAPSGSRDEQRKKYEEIQQGLERKLMQLFTSEQATEYEAWAEDTGGLGGWRGDRVTREGGPGRGR